MRAEAAGPLVVFKTGPALCALPVGGVSETMRPLPIEAMAGAPAFVLGLSIIRGIATPVVDLGQILGAPRCATIGRFLLVRAGRRAVALAVDEVVGILDAARLSLHELSPLLRGADGDVVVAVGHLDAELLLLLQSAQIVPESFWERLADEVRV